MIFGLGLRTGLFPGGGAVRAHRRAGDLRRHRDRDRPGDRALPDDFERRLARWASSGGAAGRARWRVASAPASAARGVRDRARLIRERESGVLGAVAWWGFDIATLWACVPRVRRRRRRSPVIVMAYFIGMLGNLLPLPGGIGGVDGGMIGALVALRRDAGLAVVSVLVYRAFSFWLPTIPGAIAYLQLRRTVERWRGARGARAGPSARRNVPLYYTL